MIPTIVTALRAVTNARFFETERGYQGELLAELRSALPGLALDGEDRGDDGSEQSESLDEEE